MKKFSEVAHLYVGCKVSFENACGEIGRVKTLDAGILSCIIQGSNYKPILYPLSSMSEGQIQEIERINDEVKGIAESYASATLFMTSQHFDLFNLIENGEAIDGSK